MNTVRRSSIAILLTAFALVLGIIMPSSAQAAEVSGWPVHFTTNMIPDSVTAFGNDTLSFVNCGNTQQAESFQYVHEGVTESSLSTSQVGTASPPHEGVTCGADQKLATADGTFYTTYTKEDASGFNSLTFVAMKNGRTLWSSDLNSQNDSVCSSMSGWGSESHNERMTFASQGSDGNIYGIVQQANYGCATYLAGISGVDGHVIFKQPLTIDGASKATRLWVYNDHLMTIDYTGKLRQFGYDGTENVAAGYQFPSSLGMFGNAYANAAGRVFAVGMCSGSVTDTFLAYHDPNGDNNVAASGLGCNPNVYYTPGANGTLVAYDYYGTVKTFSFTTTGISTTTMTVPAPSGVSNVFVYGYWQDQSGNAVMLRQLYGSSWSRIGVTADEINGSSGVVTNLFTMRVDSTHPNPYLRTADASPDGYLYPVICNDMYACPNTAATDIDAWTHKIPLTGLVSAPIKDTGQFATHTSTDHTLVALGDSYSSGESNSPYLTGTDQTDDLCHRSAAAYPELLEKDTSLHLNMTAFVACSGAKVHDILNANSTNLELPQAVSVESQPDIITMSIGGNDVQFAPAMQTCTVKNAETSDQTSAGLTQDQVDQADCAQALSTSASLINTSLGTTLTNLYNSLNGTAGMAPAAKLLVVGYPQLFPSYGSISGGCTWGSALPPPINGAGTPSGRAVSSTEVGTIRSLTTQMNDLIQTAVDNTGNSNVIFVDPTSAFGGHQLCTSNPWMNGVMLNADPVYIAGSYHPNAAGQAAYESAVAAKIATLTFP